MADAAAFAARLHALQSDEELRKIQRYFKSGVGEYGDGDVFIGVKMGSIFAVAKEFTAMAPDEIEKLLESPIHEMRVGACSIMAKQFAAKKTTPQQREELFNLYLRRHDRINNWDLVDLAAREVVGAWLADKPRDLLFQLARSGNIWQRRTAMLATMPFLRMDQHDDAYAVAQILLNDGEDLIHKVVGGVLRFADDKDLARLTKFLDTHASAMPRVMLRYACEHLDAPNRRRYMNLTKGTRPAPKAASSA